MISIRSAVLSVTLALTACGPEFSEGFDPITGEGIEQVEQSLAVDDLYNKLRQAEGLMTMPLPSETVVVGTLNGSTGAFTGLTSRYVRDPLTGKPRREFPFATINAVDLIVVFNVSGGGVITLTANGQTATSYNGTVSLDLGRTKRVDWTLQVNGSTRSDTLLVSRPNVVGAGAFTVAALPISIVYEPPMNQARTNSASVAFRQEMTTVTTLSNGSSNSSTPKWAEAVVVKDMFNRLAKHSAVAAGAKSVLSAAQTLLGSSTSTTTNGTTVNHDGTLGLSQVHTQTISTNAKLGPGRGDLIVFYKNARVLWGMENGDVTLTLIDHGPLGVVSFDSLLNDLNAVRAGQVAPVTGLDAPTLEALIKLDPLAPSTNRIIKVPGSVLRPNAPTLDPSRFNRETSLILSGSTFQNSFSHTITQSDRNSIMSTSTTVTECNPGWLSLIGVGQDKAGKFTTSVSLGSSRTDTVSSTVSASFSLSAAAGESYTVEVFYDKIFGSFLTRIPPPPPLVFNGGLAR